MSRFRLIKRLIKSRIIQAEGSVKLVVGGVAGLPEDGVIALVLADTSRSSVHPEGVVRARGS